MWASGQNQVVDCLTRAEYWEGYGTLNRPSDIFQDTQGIITYQKGSLDDSY